MDSSLEKRLEALSPRGLSPQSRVKFDDLIDQLAGDVKVEAIVDSSESIDEANQTRFWRWDVAAAIAIGVGAAFYGSSTGNTKQETNFVAASHAEVTNVSYDLIRDSEHVTETQNEGVSLTDESLWPIRVTRYSVVSQQQYEDESSGLTITVSTPAEQVILMPDYSF